MTEREKIFKELEHEFQYYSEHTKKQYRAHVSDYLDFVGDRDWRAREVLYEYMDSLKIKRKLSQNTINYIVRGPIGILFRMNSLRIPVKLPRVNMTAIDLDRLIHFSEEEIVALIKAAKASGNKIWQAIMALATVYGLRAGEIQAIRREDVHPKKRTIIIRTLKGGLLTEHTVPPEIQGYTFGYDYPFFSDNQMYNIFRDIASAAGIDQIPRKCYHALRHGVITCLDDMRNPRGLRIFDDKDITRFFRWKEGGIKASYSHPSILALDTRIFARHPFLKYWKS